MRISASFLALSFWGAMTRSPSVVTGAPSQLDDPIDAVLLEDTLPPSSPRCVEYSSSSVVGEKPRYFTYDHSPSPASAWNPWHGEPFEKQVFLAEMRHDDADDETRSWRLRVGTGGNAYSFLGHGYGEAMPPQAHELGSFMDEVWQTVSVNQKKNREAGSGPYFVHQAGVYGKERPYTRRRMFYAPTIARRCAPDDRVCTVSSWGQQAHVPSAHRSDVIYTTRYRDCGDGALEITYAVRNDSKDETLGYFNVPWGGVRTSNLRDVILSDPDGRLRLQFPVAGFGSVDENQPKLEDTGGFTTFAKRVRRLRKGAAGASERGEDEEKDEDDDSDDDDDDGVCSRADVDTEYELPVADGRGKAVDRKQAKDRRRAQNERRARRLDRRRRRANATDACDAADEDNDDDSDDDGDVLTLVVRGDGTCRESPGHTKNHGSVVCHVDIEPTAVVTSGERGHDLSFTNPRTGDRVAIDQVLHWAHNGKTLFFAPHVDDDGADGDALCETFNEVFRAGDEIVVSYRTDESEQRCGRTKTNPSLTFVHGIDEDVKRAKAEKKQGHYLTRLRYGLVAGKRDYTVFTVNVRRPLPPGHVLVYRQYVVTGLLQDARAAALSWAPEAQQQILAPDHAYPRTREITLYAFHDDDNGEVVSFGAAVGACANADGRPVATGFSTPSPVTKALFSVRCLDDWYVGTDRYAFAPSPEDNEFGYRRPYACDNRDKEDESLVMERPTWKALGFFEEGCCEEIARAKYDPAACSVGNEEGEGEVESAREEL